MSPCDDGGMHVLIAPAAMGPTISAVEAATDLAAAWTAAGHTVRQIPMSTGAVGLIDAVTAVWGGRSLPVPVAGGTAVVEMLNQAEASYLEPEPALTASVAETCDAALIGSTGVVGEALLAAREAGAARIVVGLGASAAHDGGAGLLDELATAAGYPGEISTRTLEAIRSQWSGISIEVAAGTDLELIGLHGAGAELANRPGWDSARAQRVESVVSARALAWERAAAVSTRRSLLATGQRLARSRYAGAGGGAGFALALLGAQIRSGPRLVADELGLAGAASVADLLITATESLDGDAVAEGVPAVVGEHGLAQALPVVAVAWEVLTTRTDDARCGVSTTYPVLDPRLSGGARHRPEPPADRAALRRRAERIVKTWAQ